MNLLSASSVPPCPVTERLFPYGENHLPQTSSVSSSACSIQKDLQDPADSGVSAEETQRTTCTDHPHSNHPAQEDNRSPPGRLTEPVVVFQAKQVKKDVHGAKGRSHDNTAAKTTGEKGSSISSTEDERDFSLTEEVLETGKVHFRHVHHFMALQ